MYRRAVQVVSGAQFKGVHTTLPCAKYQQSTTNYYYCNDLKRGTGNPPPPARGGHGMVVPGSTWVRVRVKVRVRVRVQG